MNASALIEELNKLIAVHGDLPVQMSDNDFPNPVRAVYFTDNDDTEQAIELSR